MTNTAALGPSANFLARAKKNLVTRVHRTRSTHIHFFAFDPIEREDLIRHPLEPTQLMVSLAVRRRWT
jgi:hypothetical protein